MEYKWYFDLRDNSMTTDDKEDYVAVPRRLLTITPKEVAARVAEERTEYRAETVENVVRIYESVLIKMLCEGNSYVSDAFRCRPSITGIFTRSGIVDPDKNRCQITVSPSTGIQDAVKKVVPEFSKYVLDQGGAQISEIIDVTTGKTDGTVTRNGMVRALGDKIRCVGKDGTGMGRVVLYNMNEVEEEITVLGQNDPSTILFVFPQDLAEGDYRLEIETYFSNSSTLLKEPRTIVCPITLKAI